MESTIVEFLGSASELHWIPFPISWICSEQTIISRDGKMYKRASNACVHFIIVWVKSVTNSMLLCRKSDLCCNFALFGVIHMAFTLKSGNKIINDINIVSLVVWRSYFANSSCQIHFTLFCHKFTSVVIYAPCLFPCLIISSSSLAHATFVPD